MERKQFAEAVLTAVREKADGIFSAWLVETEKEPGAVRTGITIRFPKSGIEPCIYLDDYYGSFQNGDMDMDAVVPMVYEKILEYQKSIPDLTVQDFFQWDSIKGAIYPKLINKGTNREQLERMPYRSFMDLAVVYYIKVTEAEDSMGVIMIHKGHLELWRQDEKGLYDAALKNMGESGQWVFHDLLDFLAQEMRFEDGMEADPCKMYVLTNQSKRLGAAEILDSAVLDEIHQRIGDFIVLPSSIHEVLIVPEENMENAYSGLAEIVHFINQQMVSQEEQLSDHVYTYHGQDGRLRIAA